MLQVIPVLLVLPDLFPRAYAPAVAAYFPMASRRQPERGDGMKLGQEFSADTGQYQHC